MNTIIPEIKEHMRRQIKVKKQGAKRNILSIKDEKHYPNLVIKKLRDVPDLRIKLFRKCE